MFFFLSKVLAYLVMPFTVITVALLVSVFIRNQSLRKKLFIVAVAALYFFSNGFIANEMMLWWEIPPTPFKDIKKTYEWGVVLTGVTKYDSGPEDRVYFACGADRVTHTVQLYKTGLIKKILVSGGSGRLDAPQRKEAHEVAAALKLMGVLEDDILIESESRNTHESAAAVKKMLQTLTVPSECLLITSAYHLRRSNLCFKKVGWAMDCFSVDFHSHKRSFSIEGILIPNIEAMGNWQIILKEWTGIVAYKIARYI